MTNAMMQKQHEIEHLMSLNAEQARKIIELSHDRYVHLKKLMSWLDERIDFDFDSENVLMEYMNHVK